MKYRTLGGNFTTRQLKASPHPIRDSNSTQIIHWKPGRVWGYGGSRPVPSKPEYDNVAIMFIVPNDEVLYTRELSMDIHMEIVAPQITSFGSSISEYSFTHQEIDETIKFTVLAPGAKEPPKEFGLRDKIVIACYCLLGCAVVFLVTSIGLDEGIRGQGITS